MKNIFFIIWLILLSPMFAVASNESLLSDLVFSYDGKEVKVTSENKKFSPTILKREQKTIQLSLCSQTSSECEEFSLPFDAPKLCERKNGSYEDWKYRKDDGTSSYSVIGVNVVFVETGSQLRESTLCGYLDMSGTHTAQFSRIWGPENTGTGGDKLELRGTTFIYQSFLRAKGSINANFLTTQISDAIIDLEKIDFIGRARIFDSELYGELKVRGRGLLFGELNLAENSKLDIEVPSPHGDLGQDTTQLNGTLEGDISLKGVIWITGSEVRGTFSSDFAFASIAGSTVDGRFSISMKDPDPSRRFEVFNSELISSPLSTNNIITNRADIEYVTANVLSFSIDTNEIFLTNFGLGGTVNFSGQDINIYAEFLGFTLTNYNLSGIGNKNIFIHNSFESFIGEGELFISNVLIGDNVTISTGSFEDDTSGALILGASILNGTSISGRTRSFGCVLNGTLTNYDNDCT